MMQQKSDPRYPRCHPPSFTLLPFVECLFRRQPHGDQVGHRPFPRGALHFLSSVPHSHISVWTSWFLLVTAMLKTLHYVIAICQARHELYSINRAPLSLASQTSGFKMQMWTQAYICHGPFSLRLSGAQSSGGGGLAWVRFVCTHSIYMPNIHLSGTERNVFTAVVAHCTPDIKPPPCLPAKNIQERGENTPP